MGTPLAAAGGVSSVINSITSLIMSLLILIAKSISYLDHHTNV